MSATLRTVVGPCANTAVTATVWAMSGWSLRSSSAPRSPAPVTVSRRGDRSTVAPIRSSTSTKRASPWRLAVPSPSTVTRPPVMAAAARKYDADEASGSTA